MPSDKVAIIKSVRDRIWELSEQDKHKGHHSTWLGMMLGFRESHATGQDHPSGSNVRDDHWEAPFEMGIYQGSDGISRAVTVIGPIDESDDGIPDSWDSFSNICELPSKMVIWNVNVVDNV